MTQNKINTIYRKFDKRTKSMIEKSVRELPSLLKNETLYVLAIHIDIQDHIEIDICANTVEGLEEYKKAREKRYQKEKSENEPLYFEILDEEKQKEIKIKAESLQYSVDQIVAMMNERKQEKLNEINYCYQMFNKFDSGDWKYNTLSSQFKKIDKIFHKEHSLFKRIRISSEVHESILNNQGFELFKNKLITISNSHFLELKANNQFKDLNKTDDFIAYTTVHDNDYIKDLELMKNVW